MFRDFPVVIDGEEPVIPDDVPPRLVGGFEDVDGEFVEFAEGGALPIIHGPQGGRWLHLGIRATAIRRDGRVEVDVRQGAAAGEVVAAAAHRMLLSPTSEGYLEAPDVPVGVPRTDAEIADLDGEVAFLHLTYEAGDRAVSADLPLVFRDE